VEQFVSQYLVGLFVAVLFLGSGFRWVLCNLLILRYGFG